MISTPDTAAEEGSREPLARRISLPSLFIGVTFLVLATRLPFLGAGFGTDTDAWRIALAARIIAAHGGYTVSRFPGYPVPELVSSILSPGGAWLVTGATALLSGLAAAWFALVVRKLGSRQVVLTSLACALTPVVFVSSTESMDYLWALSFAMGGLYFALDRRPIWTGLFLGLAIGCRITSGALIIPLSILLVSDLPRRRWPRPLLLFAVTACAVGGLAFLPVFVTYGLGFFTYFPELPHGPPLLQSLTVGVWGKIGSVGVAVAVLSLILGIFVPARSRSIPETVAKAVPATCVTALALYAIAFVALPASPGYLIPAVPFFVILLARYVDRRVFTVVCLSIIVSPFVDIHRSGVPSSPVLTNRARKVQRIEMTERIIRRAETLSGKSVIVVGGPALPRIKMLLPLDSIDFESSWAPATNDAPVIEGDVKYVAFLDEDQYGEHVDSGYRVYYLGSSAYLGDPARMNLIRMKFDLREVATRFGDPVGGVGPDDG